MDQSIGVTTVETQLPAGTTRAEFCVGAFRIAADVFTGDRRVLEILRDSTRQYLEVRRLAVRSLDDSEPRAAYADGLINKAEIDWVSVIAEPSRNEGRLYGFVKKTPVRVALVMAAHLVEGNVFVDSSGTDPRSFFLRGVEKTTDRFLAVGGACITSSAGQVDETGLLIVNRTAVRLFSVVR